MPRIGSSASTISPRTTSPTPRGTPSCAASCSRRPAVSRPPTTDRPSPRRRVRAAARRLAGLASTLHSPVPSAPSRARRTRGMNVLDAIGNTSIVRLTRVVPSGYAAIDVKLEWENPTGSMKDRMARAVIEAAERDGRLRPGDTVVEYTGGSTGSSLALVCAARGYRIRIVTSDAFSQEKRDHMAALGAEITLVPSEGGLTTRKLILEMIETARAMSREPGTFWVNQLENGDSIAGYHSLGEEIWEQTGGKVDAFVQAAGAAASARGVGGVLKRH